MIKEEYLLTIKQAHRDHLAWVRRAKMLIEGLPMQEEAIPMDPTSCEFGVWFHANNQKFLTIDNIQQTLDNIEEVHHQLHMEYEFIYAVYFAKEVKTGLFKKIFSKEKVISQKHQNIAKEHFKVLEGISEKLSKLLNDFSHKIRVL